MTVMHDHPTVVDPAAVAAIARCVIARRYTGGTVLQKIARAGHPKPCEWEDYPTETLLEYLRAFNAWAFDSTGAVRTLDDAGNRRADIEPLLEFQRLPRREQRRLRYLAQYGEEPSSGGSAQTGTPA